MTARCALRGSPGWLALVAVVASAPVVHAQRRGEQRGTPPLQVTLPTATAFGAAVLPPRTYRITVTPQGLVLAHPTSMVVAGTIPVVESSQNVSVAVPTVTLARKDKTVTIVVRSRDRIYTASGRVTELAAAAGPSVTLAAKSETAIDAGVPEAPSEGQLIDRALKRYVRGVAHCSDKAQKARWNTDHPRFTRCVCPQVKRWRMPKAATSRRVDHFLVAGRFGFSFTVTPTGQTSECRVWSGRMPPGLPPAEAPAP